MKRIQSLDFMRGCMLFLMMFNHLLFMLFIKWDYITKYTYGMFGYVTAAEGFYFLSGLICALAFYNKSMTDPAEVQKKIGARIKELYRWHILILFFTTLLIVYSPQVASVLIKMPFTLTFATHPVGTLALGF